MKNTVLRQSFAALAALALAFVTFATHADEYDIPAGDANALIQCLNSADLKDGDVVRIPAGTYKRSDVTDESLDPDYFFKIEKAITVVGTDGPGSTILDCGGRWGVAVDNVGAVLSGVKVTKFLTEVAGRALYLPQGLVSNVVVHGESSSIRHTTAQVYVGVDGVMVDSQVGWFKNTAGGSAGSAKPGFQVEGGLVVRTTVQEITSQGAIVKIRDLSSSRARIVGCTFRQCSNLPPPFDIANVDFTDCLFEENVAGVSGGIFSLAQKATALPKNSVTMTRCRFLSNAHNTASKGNYPVFNLLNESKMYMTNCLVAKNTRYGASVFMLAKGAYAGVCNSTIVDNSSLNDYAAVTPNATSTFAPTAAQPGTLEMWNTIFRYNRNSEGVEKNAEVPLDNLKVRCYHCAIDFTPDEGDDGNSSTEVLFEDADNGDYRLVKASPFIDAGMDVDALADDLNGSPRPLDGDGDGIAAYDIGCYESPELSDPLVIGSYTVDGTSGSVPRQVVQEVRVSGAKSEGCAYVWTVKRTTPDGTTSTHEETASPVCTNLLTEVGTYTFSCAVTTADKTVTRSAEFEGEIKALSVRCYVSSVGSDEWPYDSWATAAREISSALSVCGGTLEIASGTYAFESGADGYAAVVDHGVHIKGSANPGDVVLDCGGNGGFRIEDDDAIVSGLTLTNFMTSAGSGAALTVSAGLASNVVVACPGVKLPTENGVCVTISGENAVIADMQLNNYKSVNTTAPAAISLTSGGTLRNSTVKGSSSYVAAVKVNGATVDGCGFWNCQQTSLSFMDCSNGSVLQNSTFSGITNTSDSASGAAAALSYKNSTVRDCSFSKCRGRTVMAASTRTSGAADQLINCLVADNETTGAAVDYASDSVESTFVNCTIARNRSTGDRFAGLQVSQNATKGISVSLINTIVTGNLVNGAEKDVEIAVGEKCDMTFDHSCFAEAPDENGCLSCDPKMRRDGTLRPTSACVDTGAPWTWKTTDTDLAGNPRIFGKGVDMGCYECQRVAGGLIISVR